MRNRTLYLSIALLALVGALLAGCAGKGALEFTANGEDFVRQGFVSRDGWQIEFEHVYITLSDIAGYQSEPAYDPHAGGEIQADTKVAMPGTRTLDLAEGGPDADPISLGAMADAPAGHYNAIEFTMTPAESGPAAGYSLVIVGAGEKDGQTVNFTIRIPTEYTYRCGEYVGDARKGFLEADTSTDLEMTFHFDHIFGDAETPMDDDLNVGAPGFAPFAALANGGALDIDMAGLKANMPAEDYRMLEEILPTMGHVGEGHCHCEW